MSEQLIGGMKNICDVRATGINKISKKKKKSQLIFIMLKFIAHRTVIDAKIDYI